MRKQEFEPVDNQQHSSEKQKSQKALESQRNLVSYLHDIVYPLCAILLIFLLIFRVVVVNGPSMNQTLIDGDYVLLVNSMFVTEPEYGDIVVISKDSFKDGEPIIKRIIATEGQKVDIDFANGIVYVNDVALDEPYTNTPTNEFEGVSFPLTVDEGCVFVLGDNRNISKDSRNPEIGLIDKREILGKAVFLFFPGQEPETEQRHFNRIGVLAK